MEAFAHPRGSRGRGGDPSGRGRPISRNKQWVAGEGSRPTTNGHSDGERWERGGFVGRGRGRGASRGAPPRKFPNSTLRISHEPKPVFEQTPTIAVDPSPEDDNDEELPVIHEPVLETQEEREKMYQELVAAREQERKTAIAEGKMDDPLVPKRLEDAITIVGTCPDMCPRFERYRRERENNLFEWETIPGTKRIDHSRAVKMYERAAGDKTLPSDLRPPHVLRKTLDYLFHDLLPRGTFTRTAQFIRDRSRAVRNDITMQHLTGRLAIECHDRCARFHILAMHFERDKPGFSLPLEEQQLMNTLQSLKEFYEDQRGRYESPNELEMRVYHRLIHIRDQRERHESIPEHISSHPVFKLTTDFRLHVQKKSEPITKVSALVVDAQAMDIFGRLAGVLREMGSTAMIYLVACILERLFGKDTIENIEAIRGELTISDIIDGKSGPAPQFVEDHEEEDQEMQQNDDYEDYDHDDHEYVEQSSLEPPEQPPATARPSAYPSVFGNQSTHVFGSNITTTVPVQQSAFSTLTAAAKPNVFGKTFGAPASNTAPTSVFGTFSTTSSAPGPSSHPPAPAYSPPPSKQPQSNLFPSSVAAQSHPPSRPTPIFSRPVSTPVVPIPTAQPGQPAKSSIFSSPLTVPPPSTSGPPFASTSASRNPFQPPATNPPPPLNLKAPSFAPPNSFTLAMPPPRNSLSSVGKTQNDTQADATPAAPSPSVAPAISAEMSTSSVGSHSSSTPPPLKIDTSVSSSSAGTSAALPSPLEPPALGRTQPVSLPSTPTLNPPPSALISHLKWTLGTPPPSATPDRGILSPLMLQTPQSSTFHSPALNNFSPAPPKSVLGISNLNGKGKAPVRPNDRSELPAEVLISMQEKASKFERASTVVRQCFGQWLQKAIDKAAYIEACKQSETYREKIRLQRSQNGVALDKKRRISMAASAPAEPPQKKRARKRVSTTYQAPRTDEELAQRFKEKQEDVERRWAAGSFLQNLRTLFKRHVGSRQSPATWQLWLSTNPESDATAIWIDRKFDVPDSGKWLSEHVFSIPVGPESRSGKAHPGLIFFECSPLEGIDDEIERKYRVLDDCSRLRDIVKGLPSRRYFIPSIMFLCWAQSPEQYPDLFAMGDKLTRDYTIKGYHTMLLNDNDKDPDKKLETSLNTISLDLEGELVRALSLRDLYKHFYAILNPFIAEWISSCSNGDIFNWKLYNLLLHITVTLLNKLEGRLRQLCEIPEPGSPGLSDFEDNVIDDSDSAYDYVEEWLSALSSKLDVSLVLVDIESHRNIEQDFPSRTFLDHLLEIAQIQGGQANEEDKTHLVLADDLQKSTTALEESLAPLRVQLSHRLNTTARRSPKRRSHSTATSETSPESKRMRLSSASSINGDTTPFSSPVMNGQYTPSPSPSITSLPPSETGAGPPKVTAAMLRALTQDLKKKYIRHP